MFQGDKRPSSISKWSSYSTPVAINPKKAGEGAWEIPAVFMQDMNFLQVARPTSSSFSAMSAIELCVQTSSADVSFATQILIVMLPLPVKIHHQDYFIFCIVSVLSFIYFRYCVGFCIPTDTLCYLRIQRRGKRRKRDAPMPQPQNTTQENRDQLLDELRSPDRPEPDKRGLNKVLVQFQVKESQILQDLS